MANLLSKLRAWVSGLWAKVTAKNTWMNNTQYLAQTAHFLGAFAVVLLFSHWGWPLWVAVLGVLTYAGVKEFWYDAQYEIPKQTLKDNVLDAVFLTAGAVVGWLVAGLS